MNWPFWSLNKLGQPLSCETIEPLLSLYVDGMASPEETRAVNVHLPDCGDCREALSWIQATQRALAARPVVAPPANLHSRIALALAASSAAPISLRPARSFTLRPSYAAAASLTALGLVLSYSLWHSPSPHQTNPVAKPATVAAVSKSSVKPLPSVLRVKSKRPLIASNTIPVIRADNIKPATSKHLPVLRKAAPIDVPISQERVASLAPSHAVPLVPLTIKPLSHPLPPHQLLASRKIAPIEKRLPLIHNETVAPKLPEAPLVATHPQEMVPVHILPPTVSVQPPVQTASENTPPQTKVGDILGGVRSYVGVMHTVALQTSHVATRQSYLGASDVMRSLDKEHFAYVDGIHSR